MPNTFGTDNYGVTKLPNAANFAKGDGVKPGSLGSGSEARGAGGLPGGDLKSSVSSPPGIDPAHVQALKTAADAGDPEAGHLLQVLMSMGAGGAGMLLARQLMNRGKGTVTGPEVDAAIPGSTSTDMATTTPAKPKVTQLKDEQIIPRPGRQRLLPGQLALPGPGGAQLEAGAQARASGPATPPKYIPDQPTNPRNMPVSRQGEVDAAYMTKAAQDAKAAKALEGANPGRAAKAARFEAMAQALRRVVR